MHIRQAVQADIAPCCQLEVDYNTDYVWQLQHQTKLHAMQVRLDRIRLPRPMQVRYPRSIQDLNYQWELSDCFFVACEGETVIGFMQAQPYPWDNRLHVMNWGVDAPHRRQGVGTALWHAMMKWAKTHELPYLMLEMQTKNHPAIAFAQKHRCQFCGYNELYYRNGDITLFFARSV